MRNIWIKCTYFPESSRNLLEIYRIFLKVQKSFWTLQKTQEGSGIFEELLGFFSGFQYVSKTFPILKEVQEEEPIIANFFEFSTKLKKIENILESSRVYRNPREAFRVFQKFLDSFLNVQERIRIFQWVEITHFQPPYLLYPYS